MATKWNIAPLDLTLDRSAFESSDPSLTKFFHANAGQYVRNNWAKVYVATHPENSEIGGYYTLSSASISLEHIPEPVRKKLPKGNVPVVHIGRLAVDKRYQGKGLGSTLLVHALKNAYSVYQVIGAYEVHVKTLNDEAKTFYDKFGFQQCEKDGADMFLPMTTVVKLFK